jgi:hypothetical protein
MIDAPSALVLASLLGAAVAGLGPAHAQILYDGDAFTVTDTSVVQGPFRAEAPSRTRLTSNYERETTAVNFKFSLNRRDNERRSGDDRRLRLDPRGGEVLTPVYVFGGRESEGLPEPTTVRPRDDDSVAVTFRVDLRPVLRSFRATGAYDPPAGAPIAAEEFEGVWILGDTGPLSRDAAVLSDSGPRRLTDPDGDGVYRTTLTFERRTVRPLTEDGRATPSPPGTAATRATGRGRTGATVPSSARGWRRAPTRSRWPSLRRTQT